MNTFEFALDLSKQTAMEPLRLRQGDKNGTEVRATIYDHGTLVTGSYTSRICLSLPDGEHYYRKAGTFSAGVATVTIDEQEAASVVGRSYGYIQLLSGSTVIASTASFPVLVLPDATADATVPETYDTAIQEAIDDLNEAVADLPETVEEILEQHHEWTTTVQDNSLTDAKLIQSGGILSRNERLMYRLANLLTHRTDEGTLAAISDAAKTPMAGLSVYGLSTQDGTPTPSSPVPIVSVQPDSEGNISLVAQLTSDASVTTTTPIDLDGHELRSLPDGTRDELTVNAEGHAVLVQRVGVVTLDGSESRSFTAVTQPSGGVGTRFAAAGVFPDIDVSKGSLSYVEGVTLTHGITTGDALATGSWEPGDSCIGKGTKTLYLVLPASVGSTVEAGNTWLQSNPVTVDYALATPVTHDLGTVPLVPLVGPDLTAQTVPTAPFVLDAERDLNVTLARLESAIAALA